MHYQQLTTYLLHARPYRESSMLGTFWTQERGIVRAIMRGGRGRKQLSERPQPFRLASGRFSGTRDLLSLWQFEVITAHTLRGNATACGLYCNELLTAFFYPNDPHRDLFAAYSRLMTQLAAYSEEADLAWQLRLFERRILHAVGYGITLTHDQAGTPVVPDEQYRLSAACDCFVRATHIAGTVSGRTLLTLAAAHQHTPNVRIIREARAILRRIVHSRLGGKRLYSLDLFTKAATSVPQTMPENAV